MIGFRHMRARMHFAKGLEPFPSTSALKRFLDYLMYVVGFVAPVALFPQIIQIYTTKSAAGISLTTWLLLCVINTLWAVYGAAHKDAHIFLANIFIALFDIVIIVGILVY